MCLGAEKGEVQTGAPHTPQHQHFPPHTFILVMASWMSVIAQELSKNFSDSPSTLLI